MSGFSVYSLSPLSLSVRTFSLLGEKGEGVVREILENQQEITTVSCCECMLFDE